MCATLVQEKGHAGDAFRRCDIRRCGPESIQLRFVKPQFLSITTEREEHELLPVADGHNLDRDCITSCRIRMTRHGSGSGMAQSPAGLGVIARTTRPVARQRS
jgi:hypothetical protein